MIGILNFICYYKIFREFALASLQYHPKTWTSFSPDLSLGFMKATIFTAAAAAAKPLQSCLTLCDPIDGSPQAPLSLGFSRQEHWSGFPFPSRMHECRLSHFSHVQLCATPWTAAHQAVLSTDFSRQEYWSGLPFPSPQKTLC